MSVKRAPTLRKNQSSNRQNPAEAEINPYQEKPRASLYNVIMKLREDVIGYRHCLLIGKINDFESKKEGCENNVRALFENIPGEKSFLDTVQGLCCILGNQYICVMQSQDDLYLRQVINHLKDQVGTTPMIENAWILHYQEELPESHFKDFQVKQVNPQQANKEIKNWNQFEKVHHIYHAVVSIGDQIVAADNAGKNATQIITIIKNQVIETLPTGEELISALSKEEACTIKEWCEFMGPPDILLEKELCWPAESELVY